MEEILVNCPGCKAQLKITKKLSGHRGKCPKCGKVVKVPLWKNLAKKVKTKKFIKKKSDVPPEIMSFPYVVVIQSIAAVCFAVGILFFSISLAIPIGFWNLFVHRNYKHTYAYTAETLSTEIKTEHGAGLYRHRKRKVLDLKYKVEYTVDNKKYYATWTTRKDAFNALDPNFKRKKIQVDLWYNPDAPEEITFVESSWRNLYDNVFFLLVALFFALAALAGFAVLSIGAIEGLCEMRKNARYQQQLSYLVYTFTVITIALCFLIYTYFSSLHLILEIAFLSSFFIMTLICFYICHASEKKVQAFLDYMRSIADEIEKIDQTIEKN